MSSPTGSRFQGRDTILVDAPADLVWRLIDDSNELIKWGPPVAGVEVIGQPGEPEALGTARRIHVNFGRKSGYFLERRIEHVPERRISYLIYEENLGLFRVASRPGFSLEIEPHEGTATHVEFTFWHDPRGVGRILNPLIRLQQHRNRMKALRSLKSYAEGIARSYGEQNDFNKTP